MSSLPFKMGLPIVDRPIYGYPDDFILRSRSKADAERRIKEMRTRERPARILIQDLGMRPDHPVPVAAHFCRVTIQNRKKKPAGLGARIV